MEGIGFTLKARIMRTISEIAKEIKAEWKEPYFGAVPYIEAMEVLRGPEDYFMADSAKDIVIYFLSNARYWRGEVAKRIKAELKDMFNLK